MTDTAAHRPLDLSRPRYVAALKRVYANMGPHHLSTLAAGVAFFGLFAIFPAIAALVMLAGLVIQPAEVANVLQSIADALPEEAATIITDQVEDVVSDEQRALGIALLLSLLISLYSASSAIKTLMDGLNAAYQEEETRGFLKRAATAYALTLVLIAGFILACAVTVAAPILLEALPVPGWLDGVVTYIRWPLFAAVAVLGLGLAYRFGPSRRPAQWRWLSPGAITATLIWVGFSVAFSAYVRNFGSYTETYGALGGVVILLTWLWLSAFIVLLGAELNAELERETPADTTTGKDRPMGERGARVADTPPPKPA